MDYMSLERHASRLGASMIMEGSRFQAIIVPGKKENQTFYPTFSDIRG